MAGEPVHTGLKLLCIAAGVSEREVTIAAYAKIYRCALASCLFVISLVEQMVMHIVVLMFGIHVIMINTYIISAINYILQNIHVLQLNTVMPCTGTPPMSDTTKMIVDTLYQDRLETLLSVDDLVGEVVATLQTAGVLDNTYIFYNSDHGMYIGMQCILFVMVLSLGYHLGQFNQQVIN